MGFFFIIFHVQLIGSFIAEFSIDKRAPQTQKSQSKINFEF